MKRLAIALVVIGLLAVSQVTQAVTLEEWWYVKLGGVALWWIDPTTGYEVGVDWDFTTEPGAYGPFVVTTPNVPWSERLISISNTTDVSTGTHVDLFGQPEVEVLLPIFRIDVAYETLYNPSCMRLELIHLHSNGLEQILWSQMRPDHAIGAPTINLSNNMPVGDTIFLRVTTVPEPSPFTALFVPCAYIVGHIWRKIKR
ncbi:MAG: hypothetical protein GX141_06620 [Armatimonadetes bacterium]|nr:hypothetical protein [Armatimonadota bacterium]